MYRPLNSYLYIHWVLDFKYILLLLYKLNHSDDTSRSVSVSITIRIYNNTTLSVWINNAKLLQSALDWILSHNKSSLQLWSQLHNIDDLSTVLLVSGYVAHKSISHISCEDCKLLFGIRTGH